MSISVPKMGFEKFKTFIGVNEMKNYTKLLKQVFAEFLGTFVYLCLAPLCENGIVATALANGLLVSTVVQIIGNVSGGHINPALTTGAVVCGDIKLLKALCYIMAQVVGAIAGSAVSYAITAGGKINTTSPHHQLRADQIFALEFIMTFLLVAVFVSVVDVRRGARGLGSAPLAVGLSITACQCACLPYSGSLNPVRSLGPAVIMNEWSYHWVYWVAPMTGGAVAGLVYRLRAENLEEGSNHFLRFDKPQILAKEHRFLPKMIRKAIEIKKHPNFNREDGWKLAQA